MSILDSLQESVAKAAAASAMAMMLVTGSAGPSTTWSPVPTMPKGNNMLSSSPSTLDVGLDSESHANLAWAKRELAVARGILAVLWGEPSWGYPYLEQIRSIFEEFEWTTHGEEQPSIVAAAFGVMASQLDAARIELLKSVPTARGWMTLARAIDADARLSLPKRFIRQPMRIDTHLDPNVLSAAVWARGVAA